MMHICQQCGDEVIAVDNKGWCVSCITMAHMDILIKKIEGAIK